MQQQSNQKHHRKLFFLWGVETHHSTQPPMSVAAVAANKAYSQTQVNPKTNRVVNDTETGNYRHPFVSLTTPHSSSSISLHLSNANYFLLPSLFKQQEKHKKRKKKDHHV